VSATIVAADGVVAGCGGDVRECLIYEALAVAAEIESARDRSTALFSIAVAQAETNDSAGALVTIRAIDDPRERSEALASVADAQARMGDIGGALATARSIEGVREQHVRMVALRTVAVRLAE